MIATVARKEFRGALRDGRVLAGACVLLLLGLVALASAGARYASLSSERAVAQAMEVIDAFPGWYDAAWRAGQRLKLGLRSDDYVEVKEGVKAGEQIVVAANFLIDSESNLKAALGGMKETKPAVSHHAVGTLDSIESDGSVMVTHEPVASLNWPTMTMAFVPANAALIDKIKPGAAIHFEFVERKPGEWVITQIGAH